MCGIAGIAFKAAHLNSIVDMTDRLQHRGPDGRGIWIDEQAKIAFGHRRLAIIDLSSEGHQPMHSASNRYVITFNGEIYNFKELRIQLEDLSAQFRGHSDTEVLLAAIEQWGFEKVLQMSVGMFVLAVWDKQEQKLYLARDRFGEKPLYYGWMNGAFIFASELKALRQYADWRGEIDRNALASYMAYGYVPTPYSIYKDIQKLTPGTYFTVSENNVQQHTYWSAVEVMTQGMQNNSDLSFADALNELERRLAKTVADQSIADVPLGAFLSGGVDSSTVVAFMQKHSSRAVKTFSIGFEQEAYNEAKYAKAVAEHLGTDHTELYVSSAEAQSVVPLLPQIYDEPFADSSQIPTYLVSQLAKQSVTVSLSGDGGDELFGGYNRYLLAPKLWQKLNVVPYGLRRHAASLLEVMPTTLLQLTKILPRPYDRLSEKLDRISALLKQTASKERLYQSMIAATLTPNEWVLSGESYHLANVMPQLNKQQFVHWMMGSDTLAYLPDDILTKVDRAGMAVSLETRIPFLDHRIFEFIWQLPLHYKVHQGDSKYILRQLLYRHVPKNLVERPKMGFGVPLDIWLRGPLKEWASQLLDRDKLRQQGYLNADLVHKYWQEHLANKANHQVLLWHVLMFEAWLQNG